MIPAVLTDTVNTFLARSHFVMLRSLLPVLVSFFLLFGWAVAFAQSSGKPRATKVIVAEVQQNVAIFLVAGTSFGGWRRSVTAVTSAESEILDLQLGDRISEGQNIAD